MAFDFKKEYKEFYLPKSAPKIVTVPKANYIAMRGQGDPNEEDGAYQAAVGVLYAVAYTIKMSKLGDRRMAGYFDFVVPPLEGFWWQEGARRGLRSQGRLSLDFRHPPAGFRNARGF